MSATDDPLFFAVVERAFARWLRPENFDGDERQRERLEDLRAEMLG